jgi:hypothetical protein
MPASIKNDVQTPLCAPHGGSAFILPYTPCSPLPSIPVPVDPRHAARIPGDGGGRSRLHASKLAAELVVAPLGNLNTHYAADDVLPFREAANYVVIGLENLRFCA